MSYQDDVTEFTLESLNDHKIGQRFKECVDEFRASTMEATAPGPHHPYDVSNDRLKATITLVFKFDHHLEKGTDVDMDIKYTPPKLRGHSMQLMKGRGGFMIEKAEQLALPGELRTINNGESQ
jgi:hypothetical protein